MSTRTVIEISQKMRSKRSVTYSLNLPAFLDRLLILVLPLAQITWPLYFLKKKPPRKYRQALRFPLRRSLPPRRSLQGSSIPTPSAACAELDEIEGGAGRQERSEVGRPRPERRPLARTSGPWPHRFPPPAAARWGGASAIFFRSAICTAGGRGRSFGAGGRERGRRGSSAEVGRSKSLPQQRAGWDREGPRSGDISLPVTFRVLQAPIPPPAQGRPFAPSSSPQIILLYPLLTRLPRRWVPPPPPPSTTTSPRLRSALLQGGLAAPWKNLSERKTLLHAAAARFQIITYM
jgi:hypothetical protein